MKTSYYKGLSANAHENPSYWFSGMTRDQLPRGYKGNVAKDASGWDLWNGFLSVIDDAVSGSRGARRWVISTFVDYQDAETIQSLSGDAE